MRRVKKTFILGYDAVSPLGTDMEIQWRQAVQGESGIGPLSRFPLKDDFPVRVAEVSWANWIFGLIRFAAP